NVSIIVQFLIALVGLGVAIDYALLIIFRFREELGHGDDVESAVVTTMRHAGRSVIVSGSTVAVGLLSMVLLPLPFLRSSGIGGRDAIATAGISAGVYKPFEVLIEGGVTPAKLQSVVARVAGTAGVDGAVAPKAWRRPGLAVVEAIPSADGASGATKHTISRL